VVSFLGSETNDLRTNGKKCPNPRLKMSKRNVIDTQMNRLYNLA